MSMKEILVWIVVTVITLLSFLLSLILGLTKKNRKLKKISILLFIIFLTCGVWTGKILVTKSYYSLTESFKPRTGIEIYEALFGKSETYCIHVLNYQDQVVPKIDYAIWLNVKSCPAELKRILGKHTFSKHKIPTTNANVPHGEMLPWFNPT